MAKAIVGIIGGSGVYKLAGLTDVREERVATPWGEPSDVLRFGRSATRRRCSSPVTARATASRPRRSTTAPTSTR